MKGLRKYLVRPPFLCRRRRRRSSSRQQTPPSSHPECALTTEDRERTGSTLQKSAGKQRACVGKGGAAMSKLMALSKRPKIPSERDVLKAKGYQLGKVIGEGTYSKVHVMMQLHEKLPLPLACKIIKKKLAGADFTRKFLPRELEIIGHMEHRSIVTVHHIFEANESIYIIMDYCRLGDLLEHIRDKGALNDAVAKSYFRQLVSAVSYLHAQHIAHRDIKCENVLLASPQQVKLGDFGFARYCANARGETVLSETYCGSAAYAAPEIIQGIPYDPKMYDIWALGCILYIMISATMPFDDTNVKKMLKNQLSRNLCVSTSRPWQTHSLPVKNLLAYLLEPDIEKRATIRQVENSAWLRRSMPSQNTCTEFGLLSKSSIF